LLYVERYGSSAADAEFFDIGQEVGDDVVGVGGISEAGGGEVGCEELEQRAELRFYGSSRSEGVDDGELHEE
jgi:hypothetical protein